jgi:periplasmic divalent cation tolerance protein
LKNENDDRFDAVSEYICLSRSFSLGCIEMSESTRSIRIVLTTCASPGEASRLGRTLVEERLAACATLIPAVQSIYHWQGQIESSTEALLLIKTNTEQLTALEIRLHQLHTYKIPEFVVLGVEAASHPYFDWLMSSLRHP